MNHISEITQLKKDGLSLTFESAMEVHTAIDSVLRKTGQYYGYGEAVVQMLVADSATYTERNMQYALDKILKDNIFKTSTYKTNDEFQAFLIGLMLRGQWV